VSAPKLPSSLIFQIWVRLPGAAVDEASVWIDSKRLRNVVGLRGGDVHDEIEPLVAVDLEGALGCQRVRAVGAPQADLDLHLAMASGEIDDRQRDANRSGPPRCDDLDALDPRIGTRATQQDRGGEG
jgi:hypothetical protein